MTTDIASRAMLVQLNISQWTARKLDRMATAEVTTSHAAASDAGRFNKQIVDKTALLPIAQIASAARMYLYGHTLPWADNGDRVLSSMNYFKVMDELRKFKASFDAEVNVFCADYTQHRERARLRLNSLFKEEDYPQTEDIRNKFSMTFGVLPLPTAGDFRVAMSADVVDEVRQEIEEQLTGRVRGLVACVWEELGSTVSHLRDRLQSGGKLHDSALENLVDLLERLPGLNITNDQGIEQMRQEIKKVVQGVEMKDIKKDDKLKQGMVDRTTDILRQMQGMYGGNA